MKHFTLGKIKQNLHFLAQLSLVLMLFSCVVEDNNSASRYPQGGRYSNPNPYRTAYPKPYPPRSRDGYYYGNPNPYPQSYGNIYNAPPTSRQYNNPYSFPPQNQYPYYDGDHYYVPPTYYGATDGGLDSSMQSPQ